MLSTCRNVLFFALAFCFMVTAASAQDYTGWWWNEAESGTGYSLEVQAGDTDDHDVAYMVWYVFDESGLNTWYASILKVDGDTMTGDLSVVDGWPLEPDIVSDAVFSDIGDVTLSFTDENNGSIEYVYEGTTYQRTFERWEQSGSQDPRNFHGWWYDADKSGIGWFMESRNERFFLGWYNYREDPAMRTGGMPRWYITVEPGGLATDSTSFSQPLLDYADGQTLTGDYVAPDFVTVNDGEIFDLAFPASGEVESFEVSFGGNDYHLVPFDIPDIFEPTNTEGCAPTELYRYPEGSPDGTTSPTLEIIFELECDSEFDEDATVMTINGEIVNHLIGASSSATRLNLRYQASFQSWTEYYIEVTVADIHGNTTTTEGWWIEVKDGVY